MASQAEATQDDYKVVGTRPGPLDGLDKVTGRALYGADIRIPGLLFGKVLRSPHAHARIKAIDTSKAEAHPDVRAVATATDLAPVGPVGKQALLGADLSISENVLARDKVLYRGHAVAAIAATSAHVAEQLVSLIEVEYEPLPAVITAEEAMKPGAPILHEHWTDADDAGETTSRQTNIANRLQRRLGNLQEGLAAADLIVEREFRTKTVHQGYIEPQNTTAWWAPGGRLTIWCTSQGHFLTRDNTARILGVPISDVRVIPMELGGGFGGKTPSYLEPVAAVLSRKSGHPVRMTMTRSEVLEATGPTSGSYVRVKMGVTNEGRITAAQAHLAFEAGAYAGAHIEHASHAMFAPYNIENVELDAYDVVDNKPKVAAYRAPGAPIAAFAVESVVDEICEHLKMDPIEFRLLNVAEEGTRRADGVANVRIGARQVMERVKACPHYAAPLEGRYRGRGVGMGFSLNTAGEASVIANVLSNGTVSLIEGSADISGSRTAVSQQFAEALGLPAEDVMPQVGDTDTIGYTSVSGGSGVAYKSGWAAIDAAGDVKRQLVGRAAMYWEVPEDRVEYSNGELRHISDPQLRLSFKEICALLSETGGPVVGRASLNVSGTHSSYTANIVDVEVDLDTGKVTLLRYTAFQDAGKAVHPGYVEGQIQGGTTQGIGWALSEEYYMSDAGQLLNSSFLDYRMPTTVDVPMIEAVIVEVPSAMHPFGVRGVGEASIVPPLATIANAVYHAVGVRMTELPMSPQAIVKALRENARLGG